jgi:hypothetical protein
MRCFITSSVLVLLVLVVGNADAQLIVEDFDSQATGSPPAWLWWNNGSSGTILVDETTFRGSSGKSVELVRTTFDDYTFGFGRNFRPIDGPAELTYYFRVGSTTEEILTAVGGNNSGHQVAWWVGVGGAVGNAIGTHSHSGGWNHVMDVASDTWYGVTLDIYPSTFTYDITVWEDGNPGTTATETGIPFRDGSDVEVIDQIQFGNFSDASAGPAASAFVDDVEFVGARILKDDFERANTSAWSNSTRPLTAVTHCGQVVTTDAILTTDLVCLAEEYKSYLIDIGASNITLDLGGHVLTGHPEGNVIWVENVEGVTVKNGVITDSLSGIGISDSTSITVENVMVQNLVNTTPEDNLTGVGTSNSDDIVVRDCFFDFFWTHHRSALRLATSEVTADNIEVSDGGVGVDISGGLSTPGTQATIINSRFLGSITHGILVQRTEQSLIADNEFDHTEEAVTCDTHLPGTITGLTVENNSIRHSFVGVHFWGNESSSIVNNDIAFGVCGILLDQNMMCLDPLYEGECYYATDNVVSGNTVTNHGTDLRHHPSATGNTWTDNICSTKEGAEIPACIPP